METNTCYPPLSDSSKYYNLFTSTFSVIAPVNICLSLLILLWNSVVISYFYKNYRRRVTPALFLLIGVSDVITAVGHLVFDTAAIIYMGTGEGKITDSIMTCCFVLYRFLAQMGYSSSIFLNTMLAVMRTVKIVAPFRLTNVVAVKVFGVMWGLFLLAVTLCDCVITAKVGWVVIQMMRFCENNDAINFPGQTIAYKAESGLPRKSVEVLFLSIFYIIPVLVVFGSMVVQVLKTTRVYWTSVEDEDRPLMTDWAYVNTTVCLLAAVFLICNSATSVYAIYVSGPYFSHVDHVVLAVFSSTLPLFNALLSPFIIVTRSSNLRVHFSRRVTTFYRCGRKMEQRRFQGPTAVECRFCKRKYCRDHSDNMIQ